MVVAGRDVNHQRTQRVKRRFVAPFHFQVHLFFDLVHRNVAGTFDHHLNIMPPGLFRKFTENFQFGELRFVAGICDASRAQAVPEREAHVMFLEDFADLIEVLVEEILFLVMRHPVSHQRAAATHNAGDALTHERHVFAQHARMDGHVIDALLGLLFDDFEHQVEG